MRMIFGYARVSTAYQNLDAQIDALKEVGAEKIFIEKLTGKSRQRPGLEKLLEQLRKGDVIIVTKYDDHVFLALLPNRLQGV